MMIGNYFKFMSCMDFGSIILSMNVFVYIRDERFEEISVFYFSQNIFIRITYTDTEHRYLFCEYEYFKIEMVEIIYLTLSLILCPKQFSKYIKFGVRKVFFCLFS